MHTTEYHSKLKRYKILICLNVNDPENMKTDARKSTCYYNNIHTKCPEKTNPQKLQTIIDFPEWGA